MASKRRVKSKTKAKKAPAKKRGASAPRKRAESLKRPTPKGKPKPRPGAKAQRRAPARKLSSAAQKSRATKEAAHQRQEAAKLARSAGQRYGRNSETAKRVKEASQEARRWELEARTAKTLAGKLRAMTNAAAAKSAAFNTLRSANREATHGQARKRGWVELRGPSSTGPNNIDTFTSYEHARQGAGSVLSLLESRPGIVGVLRHLNVSRVASRNPSGLTAGGQLKPALQRRANAQAAELGLVPRSQMAPNDNRISREDFDEMLIDAELYGVELELEVENYLEGSS